jgi:hypothetical protein
MLQPFDEAPSGVFRLQPVKKVGAGFAVGFLALDHVIGHDEPRMGDGPNRALLAAPRGQPPILRTQVGTFCPRGGVGRLHGYRTPQAMTFARLA